jgi:hypothetical protein
VRGVLEATVAAEVPADAADFFLDSKQQVGDSFESEADVPPIAVELAALLNSARLVPGTLEPLKSAML